MRRQMFLVRSVFTVQVLAAVRADSYNDAEKAVAACTKPALLNTYGNTATVSRVAVSTRCDSAHVEPTTAEAAREAVQTFAKGSHEVGCRITEG